MENLQEIYDLAKQRLRESRILFDAGEVDGAFYLAGYSVELMLKWKICKNFEIPNLFSTESPPMIEGVKVLKDSTYTHNLYILLLFSGLRAKFDTDKGTNMTLFKANSLLFSCWNPNVRYKPCGHKETSDVENLLSLLESNTTGLIKWIEVS